MWWWYVIGEQRASETGSQRPWQRSPSTVSTVTCPWPGWAFKLEDFGCGLDGEEWAPPGLISQDMLKMNEYTSAFQTGYVKETGYVLNYATTLRPHPVKRKMMMMIIMMRTTQRRSRMRLFRSFKTSVACSIPIRVTSQLLAYVKLTLVLLF